MRNDELEYYRRRVAEKDRAEETWSFVGFVVGWVILGGIVLMAVLAALIR